MSATHSAKKDKNKKLRRLRNIKINPIYSYAENHIWSPQFKFWGRYQVRKPRLPSDYDRENRWVELPEHMPKSFTGFIGKHNQAAFNALNTIFEKYEAAMLLPDVLTIFGPSGTGKSATAHVFVNKLIDEQNLSDVQASKWCCRLDAKHFINDFSVMWSRISKFADNALERFILARFRYVFIDNYDAVPPSAQQGLKKVMEAFPAALKFLMVCRDPRNTMISFVLSKSTNVRTRQLSERDALQVLLSLCSSSRIGYELEGIRRIFKMIPHLSLSEMMDLLQRVFVQEHFVSEAFVLKVSNSPPLLLEVTERQALEPLQRCSLCTLLPPCQHISLQQLNAQGAARRVELPRYKKGSMACPEYVRCGFCSAFNRSGHCSLDHPRRGLHKVLLPPPRCPQCTIVWPCGHCDFTQPRQELLRTIEFIRARIGRMKNINCPDPPLALTKHLDGDWRLTLQAFERHVLTAENLLLVESTSSWLQQQYCVDKSEYTARDQQLKKLFGDFLASLILEDVAVAVAATMAAKAANRNQTAGTPPTTSQQQQQQQQGILGSSSSTLESKLSATTLGKK